MKSKYLTGEILFAESTATPFIHDGWETADGLGVALGFVLTKKGRILCRTSGKGNFQTTSPVRYATEQEREWLLNQIAIAKDIPFYSCIQ